MNPILKVALFATWARDEHKKRLLNILLFLLIGHSTLYC